jgi:hypothetical protein
MACLCSSIPCHSATRRLSKILCAHAASCQTYVLTLGSCLVGRASHGPPSFHLLCGAVPTGAFHTVDGRL